MNAVCPTCDGEGVVLDVASIRRPRGPFLDLVKCPDCDGTEVTEGDEPDD